MYTTENTKGPN